MTTHAKNGYTLTTIQERAIVGVLQSGKFPAEGSDANRILYELGLDLWKREEQRKRYDMA